MLKYAIPVLHVARSAEAEAFYTEKLGFRVLFTNRPDPTKADPCYLGLDRDGVDLHLSSFPGDGASGSVVFIEVVNVDALHSELRAKGVPIDTPPVDQTWGNREMYIKDADGNCLRFVQTLPE